MESKWRIRQAEEPEVELYLKWADREGWVMRPEITRGFYKEFPYGWFICELISDSSKTSRDQKPTISNERTSNKAIGVLHCVKYRSNVGFIGFFVVDPEHRGQGFGQKMFQYVVEDYLFAENGGGPEAKAVGLFAMKDAVPFYMRHGFQKEEETVRFLGKVRKESLVMGSKLDGSLNTQVTGKVEIIRINNQYDVHYLNYFIRIESDLEEVVLMDEKYNLTFRPGLWRNWIEGERKSLEKKDNSCSSVLYRDVNGRLAGMGMLGGVTRQGLYLLRLGPVYAESFEIFKAVVTQLLIKATCFSKEDSVVIFVDLLVGNKEACDWYEKTLGLEKTLTTIYMWKGDSSIIFARDILNKTYALAALDFP